MAAGATTKLWELADMVNVLEEGEARPNCRSDVCLVTAPRRYGGFHGLMVGLQKRIVRSTCELRLTSGDLRRIPVHGFDFRYPPPRRLLRAHGDRSISAFPLWSSNMKLDLSSANSKIKRAKKHVDDIIVWHKILEETNLYTWSFKTDTETGQGRIQICWSKGSEPDDVAVIVGDAVHNLRAALDHVAAALWSAAGYDPREAAFPIDEDRTSLVHQPKYRKIERLAPDVAIILADFIGPNGTHLVALNHLDRADKHRSLIAIEATPMVVFSNIKSDSDASILPKRGSVLVHGRLPTPGSVADLHNRSNRQATFHVVFGQGLPLEHEPVVPTLQQLIQLVSSLIQTLETPPKGS
jgi:hypothetical protein